MVDLSGCAKLRIVLVTQWFDPEPFLKGLAFAQGLVALGHDVEVITGFPNYPGGKLYPGYKQRLFRRQTYGAVRVLRVPLYPSHDSSGIRRALGYLSFGFSSFVVGGLLTRRPDVIYVYHPPLTTAVSGALLGAAKRAPFVLDIQDLWPDTLTATGMVSNDRLLRAVGGVCQWVYRKATRIVVLSSGFKRVLVERDVAPDKIDVIFNWFDGDKPEVTDQRLADDLRRGEHFNVVFAGTMGKAQGLETVLEAAALLADREPSVRFVMVGGGIDVARLKALVRQRELTNVRFLPRMSGKDVGTVLAVADTLLVHLRDDPLFSITIPSKTQAYLVAGKPLLMAVRGDATDLVKKAGCGITCPPGDPGALADAVVALAHMSSEEREEMGSRGRAYYEKNMSLSDGIARFDSVFLAARAAWRS
jgi:glycosyltransferase involved in cell wall biosynthesis